MAYGGKYKLLIEINAEDPAAAGRIAQRIGHDVVSGEVEGVENDGPNGETWEFHLYDLDD